MNFLNIGPMELIIILILALIIFGPSRLPEIGRALGRSLREFRRMTQEFTETLSEFEEEIEGTSEVLTSTVSKVKQELEEASKALISPVTQVKQELEGASQELREAVGLGEVSSGGPDEGTSPQERVSEREFPPVEEIAGDEGQKESIPTQVSQESSSSGAEAEEPATKTEE